MFTIRHEQKHTINSIVDPFTFVEFSSTADKLNCHKNPVVNRVFPIMLKYLNRDSIKVMFDFMHDWTVNIYISREEWT